MKKKSIPCAIATKAMDTDELREAFLIEDLFKTGKIDLYYTDCDRAVVGSACPLADPLKMPVVEELRCDYFCQRRELGVLNIGQSGKVEVDGKVYELANKETLYIGKGAKEITFSSDNAELGKHAEFYLISYPSHKEYPTTKSAKGDANCLELGGKINANERTINQAICIGKIESSQLVMGFTQLKEGSVWNTFPTHTHDRRSEVYMYFDIAKDEKIIHLMGEPDQTRHLVLNNKDVVISPSWSIHSGVGTSNYTFCWAMGGENQRFDDMDPVLPETLK